MRTETERKIMSAQKVLFVGTGLNRAGALPSRAILLTGSNSNFPVVLLLYHGFKALTGRIAGALGKSVRFFFPYWSLALHVYSEQHKFPWWSESFREIWIHTILKKNFFFLKRQSKRGEDCNTEAFFSQGRTWVHTWQSSTLSRSKWAAFSAFEDLLMRKREPEHQTNKYDSGDWILDLMLEKPILHALIHLWGHLCVFSSVFVVEL